MATIITKNSSTASSVPLAAQLVQGELAVNVTDKRLFTENSGGTVVELGTNPSSLSTGALAYTGTLTGGTGVVNLGSGQVYKDASGNVGIGTSSPSSLAKLSVMGASATDTPRMGIVTSDYFSTPTFTGTFIIQNGTSATGTTAGVSNASLGALYFQNTSAALIYTNGGTPLVFGTTNTERMRIDASGNLGIGTSSPTAVLDARGTVAVGPAVGLAVIRRSTVSGSNGIRIQANANDTVSDTNPGASIQLSGGPLTDTYEGNIALTAYGDTAGGTRNNITFSNRSGTNTVTERARIDSSGNVGIGTSTPLTKLHLLDSAAVFIQMTDSGDGASRIGQNGTALTFGVDAANGATERARIDSSGNLLVGTTDSGKGALTVGKAAPNAAYGQICALSPTAGDSNISGMSVVKYANDSTTSQVLIRFLMNQGGTGQGQINANGANTAAFGSYSDSRLKENIVDLPSQLDNIMALRPVEYDYIESMGGGHQIGFVAQEVQAIYPDLVAENEDGMLTLTDMNKNDARLIKCIQEQQTLITALTARITALESI